MHIKGAKALVQYMVDTYGVRSYLNNITEDMTPEEIDGDIWFECPECGEPILFDDYDYDDVMEDGICPICETMIYEGE